MSDSEVSPRSKLARSNGRLWERHRTAVMKILRAAPTVKPRHVVVMINVPRNDDPFGTTLWMDLAVRLIYPGIPVAGTYL